MLRGLECASISRRWRIPPSRLRALIDQNVSRAAASLVCWFIGILILAPELRAASPIKYADEISTRLNPTGRTVVIPVPIEDQGTSLGDVLIKINPDDTILVEKSSLLERLSPAISEETRGAIAYLPDSSGFVALEAFSGAGMPIVFDQGLQQLKVELGSERRGSANLDFAAVPPALVGEGLLQPERLAGYLNVIAGVDHVWNPATSSDDTSARLDLEAVLNFGGVVFENRASYDGEADTYDCPHHVLCTYSHVAGLKRQSSRLIYDVAEYQTRITAGDTEGIAVPLQRSADLLGFSIEKSARKLAPGESMTSAGSGSFELDRSASVDVIINGNTLQTLRLRPGHYNMRDLPVAQGANTITLAITKDNGETQTLSFSSYADDSLLAEGKSEWVISGGVPSYLVDNSRSYADGMLMGSGFVRYGLSDVLTAEAQLQADNDTMMAGLGANLGTNLGIFSLTGAFSTSDAGAGAAANFNWRLVNFSGLLNDASESLYADAEYRSTDFHTPGEFLTTAGGILYPEYNYWLRLSGSYSVPVYDQIHGTISARYMFADPDRQLLSENTITGDQYGADITLSSPISETADASLIAGYSNELYLYNGGETRTADPEFRVALRINMRPDEATSVSAAYDTLGRQAGISASRNSGSGIGRWNTNIDVQGDGADETANVNASAAYFGNRGDIRVSHSASSDTLDVTGFTDQNTRQRTSLRAGTALAFAGDRVAIGAPVRGGAFGILTPHDSLAGREVIAGNQDDIRAIADQWGNGLVTDIPAYMPGAVPIDVEDLPLGYSLGSGAFQTFAPYKSGYVLEAGSAYSVSVYGTLVMENGEPVALIAGTARPEGRTDKTVSVFTNAEGRFGAEGLAPGRWIIEMPLEGEALQYIIEVPENAEGLIKAGTLRPSVRNPS